MERIENDCVQALEDALGGLILNPDDTLADASIFMGCLPPRIITTFIENELLVYPYMLTA